MNKRTLSLTQIYRFALFCGLLLVSGLALAQTGYTENPITSMLSVVDVYHALQATPEIAAPDSALNVVIGQSPASYVSSINWSSYPDLLYDIWLICVIVALVMALQWSFRWLVKRLR